MAPTPRNNCAHLKRDTPAAIEPIGARRKFGEMEGAMSRTSRSLIISVAFILASTVPAAAQVNSQNRGTLNPPSRSPDNPTPVVYGGYQIGVGDVLDVHVNDEDDISGRYQVDQDGNVKVSLLPKPVPAAGATTFQLASRLSDALKQEKILREPSVSVLILREVTQNVSILGAVMRPGVYPIEKPTTVMDLISLAGGLAPNAGNSLTVSHQGPGPNAGANSSPSANTTLNVTTLLSAKDPSVNVGVHAGDVVTVGTAPVVFVVGSVTRPGAFAVQDRRSEMTVLQAVAMAEGPTPVAALGKTIIIRQSSSSAERQEIPIDLKKVMRGKEQDQVLEANDILFVPQSGLKAGARRLGDIGAQAASNVAGYALIF
jgi:polysaccharide export outer membrane protein